jgi:sulfur transfer protein SufE
MKKQTIIVILLLIIVMACKSTQQQIKIDLTEIQKQKLIKKLDKMGELDQKYRMITGAGSLDKSLISEYTKLMKAGDVKAVMAYMAKGYKLNKQQLDSIRKLQQVIDFDNYKKVISIIKEYGYPSKKRLGVKNDKMAAFIIHPPKEINPYTYLKEMGELLLSEVKANRMDAEAYANFYDNHKDKTLREPQLYGTNKTINISTMSIGLPEIENIEKTNKARAKIGLPSLKKGEYKITQNRVINLTEVQKKEIIKELDGMGELDQKYRMIISAGTLDTSLLNEYKELMKEGDIKKVMNFKAKGYKIEKQQLDSLWKLQHTIDFDNYKKLKAIIQKYGYPSGKRLGIYNDMLAPHLVHPPIEVKPVIYLDEMRTLLLVEVKNKRMNAKAYAQFYDNIKHKILREPQLYGMNRSFNPITKSIDLPEIGNLEKANKAREEIGLPALKEGEYKLVKQ